MAGQRRPTARFPALPAKAGHYESFYIKACHPSEPLGLWIRHTVHKRPGRGPAGIALVHAVRRATGPRAVKETRADVGAGESEYIHVGDSVLGFGTATGSGGGGGAQPPPGTSPSTRPAEPLFHLPRDWMYRAPVPRTKLLSPYPDARFSGRPRSATVRSSSMDWRGMIGHNWGAQHAERWIWTHGAGFEEDAERLVRRRARPDQARPGDHSLDRQRRALPRRGAPPAGRARRRPAGPRSTNRPTAPPSRCRART